jgi:Bacterial SH3 domain
MNKLVHRWWQVGLISGLMLMPVLVHVKPLIARESTVCYEVSDPDGWVNLRDRRSDEVIARADNGTRFRSDMNTRDGWVILAAPYDGLIVHPKRLKRMSDRFCEPYVVADRDGYVNLRQSPDGKVIGRVESDMAVLVTGRSGEWSRVLTSDYRTGFIHSSRLR